MGTAERRAVVEAVHWFRGSRTARSPRTSSFRKPASQSSKCTAVCLKGLYEPDVPLRPCLGLSDKLGRSKAWPKRNIWFIQPFQTDSGTLRRLTGWFSEGTGPGRPCGTAAAEPMYCFHHSATFSSAHPLFFRKGKTPLN